MLFVLSPAKKLDYDTALPTELHTQPLFVKEAAQLIRVLKTQSEADVASLMDLSGALAQLNVERYAAWKTTFTQKNARQAVLAFNGDVYEGLNAATLKEKDLQWAQEHVAILSGLYGVLRPLDLMQAYRLEMGTKLENPGGPNLYAFWKGTIAPYLNERLAKEKAPVLVNLASEEYFKAVDLKTLKARIVQCVFQDGKNYLDLKGPWRAPTVFDNLIARGEMPVTVAIFINPGNDPAKPPAKRARTPATAVSNTTPSAIGTPAS